MTRAKLFAGISRLDEAQADVAEAKARLADTVGDIQSRLAPSRIFDDAMAGVKSTSTSLFESANNVARKRPAAVSAAVAALMLLVAHRPVLRLLRLLARRPRRRVDPTPPPKTKPAPRKRSARPKGYADDRDL